MALALAHRTQVLYMLRNPQLFCRNLTRSVPAFKGRRADVASKAAFEDDFGVPAEDDELFSSKMSETTPTQGASSKASSSRKRSGKAPAVQFDEQIVFITDRLGSNPRASHPQVRENALSRLLHHSQNDEHLQRLAEVLVAWRNDKRVVDKKTTIELIDRCLAWKPTLLLELFVDRPRYGLTIPSIVEARRIMHRLVVTRPYAVVKTRDPELCRASDAEALKCAATFAALLPAHGLPRVTEDLTCCMLLAQACARNIEPSATTSTAAEGNSEAELASDSGRETASAIAKAVEAGQRGLVAIVVDLARALKPRKEQRVWHVDGGIDRLGKGDHVRSVAKKRMSGFTQTAEVEWKWVTKGLEDVVGALEKFDKNPHIDFLRMALARRLGRKGDTSKSDEMPRTDEAQLA